MRTQFVGTISLGRWLGIPVRLHVSFLLLFFFVLFVTSRAPLSDQALRGLLLMLIWFGSVLLHEAGHLIAVARLGGSCEHLVLTPVGGVAENAFLHDPQQKMIAALVGPIFNVAAALAAALWLFALRGEYSVALLNPLYPTGFFAREALFAVIVLRMVLWTNWLLAVVNLLPAIPLDGGEVTRSLLWRAWGQRRATMITRRLSLVTAFSLCVAAWLISRNQPVAVVPAWISLPALALLIWSYAVVPPETDRVPLGEHEFFGYDFSQGFTSLEGDEPLPPQPGAVRRWLERRRTEREVQRTRLEQEEERQVDAILARLHEQGIDSLNRDERALLNRVSARYRSRTQS